MKLISIAGITFLILSSCTPNRLLNNYNLSQKGHPQYIRFSHLHLKEKNNYLLHYAHHFLEPNFPGSYKSESFGKWELNDQEICLLPKTKRTKSGNLKEGTPLLEKAHELKIRGSRSSTMLFPNEWALTNLNASDSICLNVNVSDHSIFLYNDKLCYYHSEDMRIPHKSICDSLKLSKSQIK